MNRLEPADQPSSHDADEAAVRELIAEAERWQNDVERLTALHTDDVVIVNIAGIRLTGRESFARRMAQALETRLANVQTRTEVLSISFPGPDIAIASCIKHISDENADASGDLPSKGSPYVRGRASAGGLADRPGPDDTDAGLRLIER